MTADYLLTAQDLPGWPGKCYEVDFELLMRKTFKLIEKSYFEIELLPRELLILKEIAIQHKIEPLFNHLLKTTTRKIVKAKNVYGFLITNSIRFDGSELGIKNIYDASLVVNFVYQAYNRISFSSIFGFIKRQFLVLLRERKFSKEKLPQI